jgi:hypothetical protein
MTPRFVPEEKRRRVDPEVAHQRAKKAARARWARAGSRAAASEAGRVRLQQRWEDTVDPDGVLPADVRKRLAAAALRAEMTRISALAQVKIARARAAAPTEDSSDVA